jgi:transcriptional regulator with XRE-family HTH domain
MMNPNDFNNGMMSQQQPMGMMHNMMPMMTQPMGGMMNPMMGNPNMMPPQISGPKGGTSIANIGNNGNNGNPNIHNPRYHDQGQKREMSNDQIAKLMGVRNSEKSQYTEDDGYNEAANKQIQHLVKDLNRSLDDYVPSKKSKTQTEESDDDDDDNEIKSSKKPKKESITNIILKYSKESLLLFVIYVILSQSFVKRSVGMYLPQINGNPDGSKSFVGIATYGAILTIMFMVFKKLLL